MQRLSSTFPAGRAGAALVLLRLCVAASVLFALLLHPEGVPPSVLLVLLCCVVSLATVLGVLLPMCCVTAVALQLILARDAGWVAPIALTINAAHAVALACMGAGAYSVDALLYGRRVVVLPKNH